MMIYGYNSKLSSRGIDMILDYGREFIEGLKKIRNTQEVSYFYMQPIDLASELTNPG
jgi:hypothetical protein